VERVIMISERSHSYVSSFAARLGINSVRMEDPVEAYNPANHPEARNISVATPTLMNERLSFLHHFLRNEVLG
jgi:hypothetical protein